MGARTTLLRIIKGYQLDFRFPKWRETFFCITQGIYSDDFCAILLPEAQHDAEQVEKLGNFLGQPPEEDELQTEGPYDIEIGTAVEANTRVGIRYLDRPRNTLIFGSAGSGKTVTTRKICLGVDANNAKSPNNPTLLILMDLKGDNQDLSRKLRERVVRLSTTDNLRIGLNGPPDVPPYVWISHISLSLAARLGLIVSRTCLAGIIGRLLVSLNPGVATEDLMNPTVMKDLIWPPLAMVLDAMRMQKVLDVYSSKASYGQTLIQMLSGLLQDSGQLFDCCNGLDINAEIIKAKRHCIIDATNTPPYILHLVNDYLINYLLVSRLFNNHKCDHTDVLYGYDESDILTESDWEEAFQDGLSPLNRLNRLGREVGLMSMVSISAPQAASKHIRRSAFYTIGFGLSDAESVRAAVHHFQLDPRCAKMFGSLSPGQCIVRQSQSSYSNAFWCEMDMVAPARNLGRIAYPSHRYMPALRLTDVGSVLDDLKKTVKGSEAIQERQRTSHQPNHYTRALELLRLAATSSYVPVARLMEKLGKINHKDQAAMVAYLKANKYAIFEEPRIGRRNMLLIDVTEAGYSILSIPVPTGNKGRGSITHRHYVHWIASHFARQGHQASIEWVLPGTNHPVDLAVNVNGQWKMFEIIVTASENLTSHLQACFEESNISVTLTIIAGTRKQIASLHKRLAGVATYVKHAAEIKFDVIENYL